MPSEKRRTYMRDYMRKRREEERREDAVFKSAAKEIEQVRWSKRSPEEKKRLIQQVLDKHKLRKLDRKPSIAGGMGTKMSEEQFLKSLELKELDRLEPLIKRIVEHEAEAMFKRLIRYFSEGLVKAHLEAYSRAYAKVHNNGAE